MPHRFVEGAFMMALAIQIMKWAGLEKDKLNPWGYFVGACIGHWLFLHYGPH